MENKNKEKKKFYLFCIGGIIATVTAFCFMTLQGCKTIDLEQNGLVYLQDKKDSYEKTEPEENSKSDFSSADDSTTSQLQQFPVIDSPKIIHLNEESGRKNDSVILEGSAALKKNLQDKKVPPKYRDGKLVGWVYRDGDIYEVKCQPYRTTTIRLEPGEEMVEEPYCSEIDVWRISRGVGEYDENGQRMQYVMIKPDYSGLISSLSILTNRRLYLMEISSSWDSYMPLVQWVYKKDITDTISWLNFQKEKEAEKKLEAERKKLEYSSCDYKMTYWKRPLWCPVAVYDDGQKTYIILDEQSLNMNFPAVFNKKNEIINFNVTQNVIQINQLVEKVTLKLGKEKVVITKKKK